MRFRLVLLSAILLPATAFAAQILEWDFTGAPNSQGWVNQGLDSVQETIQGLMISTSLEGQFRKDIEPGEYEAISITYASSKETSVLLLWQDATKTDAATGIPFTLQASPNPTTVSINLKAVEGWNPATNKIGFQFGAGSEILLMNITLSHWNTLEHIGYAFRSVWQFDNVRAYTINFVWGPLVAFNPIETAQVFWKIPPDAHSLNWYIYAVLIVALIIVLYLSHNEGTHEKQKWWKRFFVLFGVLWIFYDVRMTSELGQYVKVDYETFHTKSFAEQQYRDRGFFIQMVEALREDIGTEKKFVFLPFQGYPYMGQIRYMLYPSIPVNPDAADADTKFWLIFNRTDVTVNEAGQLVTTSEILSSTGIILKQFAPGTFLFRTN